jgi:hypothetical protein
LTQAHENQQPAVPPVDATAAPMPAPAKSARRWPWVFLAVLAVIFYLGYQAQILLNKMSPGNLLAVQHNETSIMSVLHSDELLFLVTDRIVTRVDVEIVESAPWAGGRQGVLMATVKLYYGIDLEKINAKDITETNDRVIVHVPYPKLLDYSMDQDSTKFFDKRTGMWALADWYNNRDIEKELRASVKHRALEFAEKEGIAPKNEKVLARLNRFAERVSPQVGKKVEFQYADK